MVPVNKIKIVTPQSEQVLETVSGLSLLDIIRTAGIKFYAPCGGKGKCGKCRVRIKNEGEVMACGYYPAADIEVFIPGDAEANILVHQSKYLVDLPFNQAAGHSLTDASIGVAIDIGTTTVVLYFLNLLSGRIEKISSFLNPQRLYGADVITRITYCQEHKSGLSELQKSIVNAINDDLDLFLLNHKLHHGNIEEVIIAGNTTMLHLIFGEDPVPIALAPFKPVFLDKQVRNGDATGLHVNSAANVITLPGIAAFVGADIVAGLAALKPVKGNYLFLDIGTNGEMALIAGDRIITCATAAGPAFEGANISCGMAALTGAVSVFSGPGKYQVIGNAEPIGICGSGLVDIVAYMVSNDIIDETGRLEETFYINQENNIYINQQDIREMQLAKSAVYSGIKILTDEAGFTFNDIDGLYLAGGFGNYINIESAIKTGLLPCELKDRIYAVGNSAVIGAFQFLKADEFEILIDTVLQKAAYIELSSIENFATEFAMNMNFKKILI